MTPKAPQDLRPTLLMTSVASPGRSQGNSLKQIPDGQEQIPDDQKQIHDDPKTPVLRFAFLMNDQQQQIPARQISVFLIIT